MQLDKELMKAGAESVHVLNHNDASWMEEWVAAAKKSDAVIMIASAEYCTSEWTLREAALLMEKHALVIPVNPTHGITHRMLRTEQTLEGRFFHWDWLNTEQQLQLLKYWDSDCPNFQRMNKLW
mmetsp:Transcript_67266/g.217113  ORF Transcript_67266/g.217113 Transcript_67266/m.217113 type:complete len:124 (-) Transcript_67266:404-775(-)